MSFVFCLFVSLFNALFLRIIVILISPFSKINIIQ